jgi:hypothetical protein
LGRAAQALRARDLPRWSAPRAEGEIVATDGHARAPWALLAVVALIAISLAVPFTGTAPAAPATTAPTTPTRVARKLGIGAIRNTVAPANHVAYFGGPVLSHVKVYAVRYGTGTNLPQVASTATPSVSSFLNGVVNSPYLDWLREYDTWNQGTGSNQTIERGTFAGLITITPSSAHNGTDLYDGGLQAELSAQIAHGHLPAPDANTLYVVFFRKGQTLHLDGYTSRNYFCAYHNAVNNAAGQMQFAYAAIPYEADQTGCGTASAFDNLTETVSHELVEAITDPNLSSWFDPAGNEVGDLCNHSGTYVTASDGVSYHVQRIWSQAANACVVSGAASSAVAVTITRPPYQDLFFRGNDGAAYWMSFNPGNINTKPGMISLGGGLASAPFVFARQAFNGQQVDDVFVDGNDNHLYWKTVDLGTGVQSGWRPLGGFLTSQPRVYAQTGRFPWLDIFVRGVDGALYANILNLATGQEGAWVRLGGYLESAPYVVSRMPYSGTHVYDVFMRGSDNAVYWFAYDANQGKVVWEQRLGGSMMSEPVAVIHGGRFPWEDIYVRDADGSLGHDALDVANGVTSGWASRGGYYTSQPVVLSRTLFNGQIADDIYGRQADSVLREQSYFPNVNSGTGLSTVGNLQNPVLTVTSVAGRFSLEDMYSRLDDGSVVYRYFDPTNSNNLNWVNLGGN